MERELSEDDLEVAEASVKFAIENCPVEGLLSNEDGTSVSLDELQTLLDKLKEAEATLSHTLANEVTSALRSVINYTSENCPVEGVSTFHDGRPILGRDIMTLDAKLKVQ